MQSTKKYKGNGRWDERRSVPTRTCHNDCIETHREVKSSQNATPSLSMQGRIVRGYSMLWGSVGIGLVYVTYVCCHPRPEYLLACVIFTSLPMFKGSNTWLCKTAKNATMLVQHNWDGQRQRIAPFLLHCIAPFLLHCTVAWSLIHLSQWSSSRRSLRNLEKQDDSERPIQSHLVFHAVRMGRERHVLQRTNRFAYTSHSTKIMIGTLGELISCRRIELDTVRRISCVGSRVADWWCLQTQQLENGSTCGQASLMRVSLK